jgi:hypothetical protein
MPVYVISLHSYRSWRADNPRGYVRHGEKTIRPPSEDVQRQWDENAKFERVRFDAEMQRVIIDGVLDACARRGWRAHAVAVTPTHVHAMVSWRMRIGWKKVSDTLKRVLGYLLATRIGPKGQRWFSRGESRRRIRDRGHMEYHLGIYLPKHRKQRGTFWREDRGLPPRG